MTTPQTPVDALMALVNAALLVNPKGRERDEFMRDIEASARALAAIPAARDGLHGAIMNLQLPMDPKIPSDAGVMLAYKMGHRDARHAAAELSIAAPTTPTAPAQDAQGERNAKMLIDIGNAALRAGWNGVDLQAFVIGRLASPSQSAVQPLSEAHGDVRVACITLDGSTLYIPAKEITDFGIGDDDGETYTLTFKTMTRAEFEALGEFDGF